MYFYYFSQVLRECGGADYNIYFIAFDLLIFMLEKKIGQGIDREPVICEARHCCRQQNAVACTFISFLYSVAKCFDVFSKDTHRLMLGSISKRFIQLDTKL